jgi:hypothetical protein
MIGVGVGVGREVVVVGVVLPGENELAEMFETELVVFFMVFELIFDFFDGGGFEGEFLVEVLDLFVEFFALVVEFVFLFFLLKAFGVESGAVGFELIELFPEEGGLIGFDFEFVFEFVDVGVVPD